MDSSYEFVGVVNLFDIYPDFLFPIYKNKNRFFFHNGAKNRIYNFEPVTMAIIDKIIYLDCKDVFICNKAKNKYYFEHDVPVYAFQRNRGEIFCAEAGEMVAYLKMFKTEDKILFRQINRFIKENMWAQYVNQLCISILNANIQMTMTLTDNILSALLVSYNEYLENICSNDLVPTFKPMYEENYDGYHASKDYIHNLYLLRDLYLFQDFIDGRYIGLVYDFHHELYNMEYCMCRKQNIAMKSADFAKLKRAFHKLIIKIPRNSLYYDVCINCQKAVIDEDENELLIIINKNYQLFIELLDEDIMENYLEIYIRQHMRIGSPKWS